MLQTTRGLRQLRGVAGGLGALALGRFITDAIGRGNELGDAIRFAGASANLTEEEFAALSGQLQGLAQRAASMGIKGSEFSEVLRDNAVAASLLAGDMERTAAIAHVLEGSMLLARATGASFSDATSGMVRILRAFGFTAADTTSLIDLLTVAYQNSGRRIGEFVGPLEELGPVVSASAGLFGQSTREMFMDVLATLATVGPEADSAIAGVLKIVSAAADGNAEARELLASVGIVLDEDGGGAPPLLQVFNALHLALAGGVLNADLLKEKLRGLISQEDAERIATVARNLEIIHGLRFGDLVDPGGAAAGSVNRQVRPHGTERFSDIRNRLIVGFGAAEDAPGIRDELSRLLAGAIAAGIMPFAEGKDLLDWFGSVGLGAEGGLVTRPTLAMIGEAGPEMVLPLHRMPGASPLPGGVGGGGIVINGPISLPGVRNPRDFLRELRRMEFESQYGKLGARKGGG